MTSSHDWGQWVGLIGAAFGLIRLFPLVMKGVEDRARLDEKVKALEHRISVIEK